MSQKDSNVVLEPYQLDHLKFQKRIFWILKILQGNANSGIRGSFFRKFIAPGFMIILIFTNVLNAFCDIEGEPIIVITSSLLIFVALSQVFCKVIVTIYFSEKIHELIKWIDLLHVDASWTSLGVFIKERFQVSLRYLRIVTM